jgi:hypothetical protein
VQEQLIGLDACSELFLETEGRNRHDRPMRFSGHSQSSPRVRSYGRKDIILSKDWRARGSIQRVGACILATVLLLGSVALFVASALLRAQVSNGVAGVSGQVLGAAVALLPLFIACALTFFAGRLIKGVARSFRK